jgi:hypothetical protein
MARPRKWHLVTVFAAFGCLGFAGTGYPQFTSFSDRSRAMLEGNWQSCLEADGWYSERVYDNVAPGLGRFELHLGPYHEFALFRGVQDEHRDHRSADNLLRPYTVAVIANRASQKWDVAGLHLEVTLAGGSRADCESWFLTLRTDQAASDE